jgi:site-specific recombinase XerD
MSAHLKTFAKWIHQHRPFPLGQPMEKIKMHSVGNQLEIERALTKQERNRILDAAAQLLLVGGRLTPRVINTVWNKVRDFAGVDKDKTPLSARHGMGVFIMEKTGNVAAVQRPLGHKNASFSLQYSRITNDELKQILDDR